MTTTPTPLSNNQWQKVVKAAAFAFISTFLAVIVTAGGISTSWEANVALVISGCVSGINAVLYALTLVFTTDTK